MLIRIEADGLPALHPGGHDSVHLGVQRGRDPADVLNPVPATSAHAWEFEVVIAEKDGSLEPRGPYIQGRPGARFIYLSWGSVAAGEFVMFGRSKLMLSGVDTQTFGSAAASGTLIARVRLWDDGGRPRMGALRPPAIEWLPEQRGN